MERRKSFVLYCDLIDVVEKLTNAEAGILFKAILYFVNDLPVHLEDEKLNDIFKMVCADIQKEWNKYNPKTKKYHWNYKGGITPENKAIRSSAGISFWRTLVFERDGFTCQICGKKGGKLNAHHMPP